MALQFLLFAVLLQAPPGADGSPPYPEPDSTDVMETARRLIDASLPLTAGDLLSRHLSQSRDGAADPTAVLLAARAYADGRAWSAVLRLLIGQPWLGDVDTGHGLLEVGRAYAGLDSLNAALAAYRRYLELLSDSEDAAGSGIPVEFRAEYASLLSRLERHAAAASQYADAAKERPELARCRCRAAPRTCVNRCYATSSALFAASASRIARHTRSGVKGRLSIRIPIAS